MTVPGRTPGDLSTEDAKLLLDVVQSLYASAMEGTSDIWHNVYRQTARLVASAAGGFVTVDLVNHATDLASVFGFDQKNVVRAYSDYGLESDLLYTHTRSMPAGSPFHGTRMFGPRGIERSPLYEILSVPERLRFVSGGVLENDERHHSILCFWRRSD